MNYVQEFCRQLPEIGQIVNLCGKLSIPQLVGLFSKSDFLITNDSGPLHIAVSVGLPTLSFFGPETPYLYGPQGDQHYVFYSDIFCSPCLNIYNSKHHGNETILERDKEMIGKAQTVHAVKV